MVRKLPVKLILPKVKNKTAEPGWYERYERLNSALFIRENSGRCKNLPAPGRRGIGGTEIKLSFSSWSILGYSLDPPFHPEYKAVAIMFETSGFEKMWWHYLADNDA